MKFCSGCQSSKPIEAFSKNKAMRDGLANWCKGCHRRLYTSKENLERRTLRRDDRWSHSLVIECRARARKLGVAFDLSDGDLVVPEKCPVLGIPLFRTRGKVADNTPTVDRLIGHLGYVRGNVSVISWRANCLKRDCDDPAVFEAIAAYIRRSRRPRSAVA